MVDTQRLLELADADDRTYAKALVGYLLAPRPGDAELFRHRALLRRTRVTLSQLLKEADQRDSRRYPENTRRMWRRIREAAKAERDEIKGLLIALPPEGAGPRRRALHRLAEEYPEEFEQLRREAAAAGEPKNMNRALLERLARRHPIRIVQLVREERERDEQAREGAVSTDTEPLQVQ